MELYNLLIDVTNKNISNRVLLDKLLENDKLLNTINEYDKENQIKIYNSLSKIELIAEAQYIPVYMKLTLYPDIWKIYGQHSMTLLQLMIYGFNDVYLNCIIELTKYHELWIIPEKIHHYTALHLLCLNYVNNYNNCLINVIYKLTKYPDLWKFVSRTNNTPLHELCNYTRDIQIHIFIELAKYPNLWEMQNNNLNTPLHFLCSRTNKNNIVSILIELSKYQYLWGICDNFNYTPLHLACRNFTENYYLPFYQNIDNYLWKIKNKSEYTPLQLLKEHMDENIFNELNLILN